MQHQQVGFQHAHAAVVRHGHQHVGLAQRATQGARAFGGAGPAAVAPHAFVDITLAGHAYSLLPEMMVAEALASGALVDLLPAQPVDLALYWHHWRVESVLARQLADTLAACGQRWLRQDAA